MPSCGASPEMPELHGPAQRSRSRRVPAAVPSVLQISLPCAASGAAKTARFPTCTGVAGNWSAGHAPPAQPVSGAVVSRVPPLAHKRRLLPSLNAKSRRPPSLTSFGGAKKTFVRRKSVKRRVLAAVPSLCQMSTTPWLSRARNQATPSIACRKSLPSKKPASERTTRRVPAAVPSEVHSSRLCSWSKTKKKSRAPAARRRPSPRPEEKPL